MHDSQNHINLDTLAAYALDALPPDEIVEVGNHLATCSQCAEELAGFRETVGLLPYGVTLAEPSPQLRGRILAHARSSTVKAPLPMVTPRAAGRPAWRWLAPALVAAIVLVFLVVRPISWFQPREPDVAALPGARTAALHGKGSGAFAVAPDRGIARLSVDGLPPLGEQRVYQLWFLGSKAPIAAGTFTVDARGHGELDMRGLAWSTVYNGVAITTEPSGGSPAPTSDIVAQGSL